MTGSAGSWRVLTRGRVTAADALRRGMALLDETLPDDPATLVWWHVDAEALVLGRGSQITPDRDACAAADVDLVRRASGGGPVLWGADLIAFDVIVPRSHPLHSDDVVDSYRWLGEAVAEALQVLDIPAHALEPTEARRGDATQRDLACFASLSPWEVVVDGRKLVGLSQVRRRSGVLLQAGILLRSDPARLTGLLRLDPDANATLIGALRTGAVGLAEVTSADRETVVTAVTAAITGSRSPNR